MRFSLYSELQLHPGKTAEQIYAEALEQIVNADRLGYDCYAAIEPYASELVGAERGIVLGKKSGIDSIRIALERLGLDVPAERHAELLALVKAQGTKHQRLVTDTEFRRLVSRVRRK